MADSKKLKDRARDELFSHINRCGVLQAADEDQEAWLEETMAYMGERYPDLTAPDLKELYQVGLRFCRPPIPHGAGAQQPG
jgi:ribonuclease HII